MRSRISLAYSMLMIDLNIIEPLRVLLTCLLNFSIDSISSSCECLFVSMSLLSSCIAVVIFWPIFKLIFDTFRYPSSVPTRFLRS